MARPSVAEGGSMHALKNGFVVGLRRLSTAPITGSCYSLESF
jgi:hypothetical protein